MDLTAAFPTFVITLREGVEATLVVGIVLAYLTKVGQTALRPWVYGGVGAGVSISVLVGTVFLGVIRSLETANQDYAPLVKQILEGAIGVLAIALLSWMLLWMTQQARFLKADVEGAMQTALQTSTTAGWGVFALTAIAVLREGFETVLFLAAQFQQGWISIGGAIAGLGGAVIIGILLFQLGVQINLRRFFQVMGILLLLIVSGLITGVLRHFDAAVQLLAQMDPQFAALCPDTSPSCILGPLVWDASNSLPDRQFPGILLKSFLGYRQQMYLAQIIDYVLFLGIVGGIYLQRVTGWQGKGRSPKPSS